MALIQNITPTMRFMKMLANCRILVFSNTLKKVRCAADIICIAQITYIEDITCLRVDMNFIFECSTRYLTSERSERVRYRVKHEKIKCISTSGHVIFCLLYKHTNNDVFDDFPKISDQFPKISEDFPKLFQRLDERFRTFSEHFPKVAEDFRVGTDYVSIIQRHI